MAKICLVPTSNTIEGNLSQIECYRDSIDLVELRVDLLKPTERPKALRFPRLCSFPTICTIRRESDGGAFAEGERERSQLLKSLSSARFAFVDLESDYQMVDVERAFKTSGARIIRSHHDLNETPADIAALYRRLSSREDEIPKIAVQPRSLSDAIRLFETALSLPDGERILLSMGSHGFFTRVLAEKMGSMLTFASPSGREAAPGHIDPESLETTYRFRSIHHTTRCIAVVGDPVMHSRSPTIHNAGIEIIGKDLVYIPLHAAACETVFENWDLLELDGISVTVPHKERVIGFLDVVDESVRRIGSCNTVVRRNGRFEGTNTDALGLLTAIQTLMPDGTLPKSALIVGAGGTARAASYVLTEAGVDLLIVNRTIEKAVSLAEEFGCRSAALDESSTRLIRDHSALIIQSTSAGMHPNEQLDPLDFYEFSGDEALLDVIYAPARTKILKRADHAGCSTMNGWEMLLKQAQLQFEIFTSVPYPDGAVVAEP